MAITWEVAGGICRLPASNETSDKEKTIFLSSQDKLCKKTTLQKATYLLNY